MLLVCCFCTLACTCVVYVWLLDSSFDLFIVCLLVCLFACLFVYRLLVCLVVICTLVCICVLWVFFCWGGCLLDACLAVVVTCFFLYLFIYWFSSFLFCFLFLCVCACFRWSFAGFCGCAWLLLVVFVLLFCALFLGCVWLLFLCFAPLCCLSAVLFLLARLSFSCGVVCSDFLGALSCLVLCAFQIFSLFGWFCLWAVFLGVCLFVLFDFVFAWLFVYCICFAFAR